MFDVLKVAEEKKWKLHFFHIFFNINYLCTYLIIGLYILDAIMEGTVSQIVQLVPSFHFI